MGHNPLMMPPKDSTTKILDAVLPLTKEDHKCGFNKAKKLRARADLIILINDYKDGKAVVLPEDVLRLLHGSIEVVENI